MLAMIKSCAVNGLDGYRLVVEVDVGAGLSAFEIVGLLMLRCVKAESGCVLR